VRLITTILPRMHVGYGLIVLLHFVVGVTAAHASSFPIVVFNESYAFFRPNSVSNVECKSLREIFYGRAGATTSS
jgi:hypothetical protein